MLGKHKYKLQRANTAAAGGGFLEWISHRGEHARESAYGRNGIKKTSRKNNPTRTKPAFGRSAGVGVGEGNLFDGMFKP